MPSSTDTNKAALIIDRLSDIRFRATIEGSFLDKENGEFLRQRLLRFDIRGNVEALKQNSSPEALIVYRLLDEISHIEIQNAPINKQKDVVSLLCAIEAYNGKTAIDNPSNNQKYVELLNHALTLLETRSGTMHAVQQVIKATMAILLFAAVAAVIVAAVVASHGALLPIAVGVFSGIAPIGAFFYLTTQDAMKQKVALDRELPPVISGLETDGNATP